MRMKIAHPMLWDAIKLHGAKIEDGTNFDLYFMSMQLFLVPNEHFMARVVRE
jgi:hypothetical protein